MSIQTALTVSTRGKVNGAVSDTVSYSPVYASNRNDAGYLVSVWQEKSALTPIGYSDLTIMSKPALGNNAMQVATMRLVIPTLEVMSVNSGTGYQPQPKVAYTNELKMEAKLPTRGTKEEKWELHARAVSAFSQAVMLALFRDNEQVS